MPEKTKITLKKQDALVVIDIQNDFLPNGALAVSNGDAIIPIVNQIMPLFPHVAFSQDWHPDHHVSFEKNHPNKEAYQTITLDYGDQTLWPTHCVANSWGAAFSDKLETQWAHAIIRKGFSPQVDSYSAFIEQDGITPTGLQGWLKERSITRIFVCGLATDFCVCYSALDGIKLGFEVVLIEDASAGINLQGSLEEAYRQMKAAGVCFVQSNQIVQSL